MNRRNRDLEYMNRLAERIREYKADVRGREEAKRKAEEALATAREKLEAAERFYRMELERLDLKAEQVELPLKEERRFAGMSAKEACVELLKEHGAMTLDQLVTELEAGGFFFGRWPKRTVNMALTGRDDIERLPDGRFRYKPKILPIDELKKKYEKS